MGHDLVRPLWPGPLDIVGDVHGEIDALRDLLSHLGYDADGVHPQGRRLVFMGDLTDRGADSPAVIEWVAGCAAAGLAQCVMGNHELNLLREARKDGNGWYYPDNHDHREGKFPDARPLDPAARPKVRAFLSDLPIALERPDLRLVHAAWHAASIAEIRASAAGALELYDVHHRRAVQLGEDTGLKACATVEEAALGARLRDPGARVPLLPGLAALDALYQDSNPVRIVTSGLERVAQRPFFASGKWRMVDRCRWWDEYEEATPVIIGHYWRWPTVRSREAYSRGEPDLFQAHDCQQWFGRRHNVFCVDFAVGARYKERAAGATDRFECRLAAVRWPEREVAFDDGRRLALE